MTTKWPPTRAAADAMEYLLIAEQQERGWRQYGVADLIAVAQVHATLALVDEQRTANLIAWHARRGEVIDRSALADIAADIDRRLSIPRPEDPEARCAGCGQPRREHRPGYSAGGHVFNAGSGGPR